MTIATHLFYLHLDPRPAMLLLGNALLAVAVRRSR